MIKNEDIALEKNNRFSGQVLPNLPILQNSFRQPLLLALPCDRTGRRA
jgi:hypothetical protein